MIEGRIIKGIGGFYYVDTDNGLYECRARGIFRKNKITPLVGDFVKISVVDEENKKGVVEEIAERETELVRPPIANVNKALIVFAVKNPTPHLSLLDRFIVLAERENLEIVIILTKIDLDDDNTFEKIKNIYEPCGYKVIGVSNLEKKNIDKVKEELKDNTVVFAGPSGVGKSSLLNEIDKNFKLKTGDVSDKIKRGKHTTRHAELFELEFGGMVADTPGFSSLTLDDIEDVDLKDYFIEFDNYDDCKFGSRCIHQNEPNCAVKEAVENGEIPKERYESYIQLLNEIRQGKRRY
ncbi:MAG: ribosome small subunit-dependent GTPase A [Clostridiales bacterium]|mgnify:FL=1|jgi:ribosome biogenesis GTPase|uniref:ribosome small subunit-dependent GTPase A n=1 Tax=Clostridia TaxID=186801 RepID=UPI0018AB62BF|nr:ribosome small subunit-dependent GTPase A [Clostridium sp. 1001270J_160509_D11]MDU1203676.1 ribosome small subunit-dependent GTPase A [Clostridiales bacterium]